MNILVTILIGLGVVILAAVILGFTFYRVADVDKVLIITGGKEPKLIKSGGAIVPPIIRKASYFPLGIITVPAAGDEIRTVTAVPIMVDWTAQIRPNTKDDEALKKAVISFKERGTDGIIQDIQLTLTGAVRDIVASMTPEEVLRDKEAFARKVSAIVTDEMDNMGMELVSLNIQDISDRNGYYNNMAALDMEDKKREAENKRAVTGKDIRLSQASAGEEATKAELEASLAIAEKSRDTDIKKAQFKAETDKAKADAAIAGQLQATVRKQEVTEQEGRVEVIRQEQANLAAQKEKEVAITRAQQAKETAAIDADARAKVSKVAAEARVEVAERDAKALLVAAEAQAEETRKRGLAEAEMVAAKGKAAAEAKAAELTAEAEGVKAMKLAEAEGERARLLAQAEGEAKLAEARASNDRVNFEIEKIRLETEARVQIATNLGNMMAEVGKNAEFINLGGAQTGVGAGTGNVLIDTLSQIPTLFKSLDVQNNALNGCSMNEQLNSIVSAVAEPVKGLLAQNETTIVENVVE